MLNEHWRKLAHPLPLFVAMVDLYTNSQSLSTKQETHTIPWSCPIRTILLNTLNTLTRPGQYSRKDRERYRRFSFILSKKSFRNRFSLSWYPSATTPCQNEHRRISALDRYQPRFWSDHRGSKRGRLPKSSSIFSLWFWTKTTATETVSLRWEKRSPTRTLLSVQSWFGLKECRPMTAGPEYEPGTVVAGAVFGIVADHTWTNFNSPSFLFLLFFSFYFILLVNSSFVWPQFIGHRHLVSSAPCIIRNHFCISRSS